MKMYIKSDNAGWILDCIKSDYKKYSKIEIVNDMKSSDIIWALNFWDLNQCDFSKKVISHVHHVNYDEEKKYNFQNVDKSKACIVYNDKTLEYLKPRVKVPVIKMPYWCLSHVVNVPKDISLRKTLSGNGEILIGSFQKDGNSHDKKPKMVKGPDTFLSVVKELNKTHNIKLILSGYCREWLISELTKANINFEYYHRCDNICKLYDTLDWYFVTSRIEGGPQAILEASYRKIKILSTDVGIASEILHPDCICNNVNDFVDKVRNNIDRTEYNYSNVEGRRPDAIIPLWDKFFTEMYER